MNPSPPHTAQQKQFWCHMCEKVVATAPQATGDVFCPECGSEFVEEYVPPHQQQEQHQEQPQEQQQQQQEPTLAESDDPYMRNILNLFRAVGARHQRRAAAGAPAGRRLRSPSLIRVDLAANGAALPAAPTNPFATLINLVQQHGQAPGVPPGAPPGAMSLDELLNHLFVTAPVRGSPPAARAAVEALPRHTVDEAEVRAHADDDYACTVCQDAFAAGDAVVQMPCEHVFHADCLAPWLAMHNSCPTCRCELPTDDPDYEDFKKARRTM